MRISKGFSTAVHVVLASNSRYQSVNCWLRGVYSLPEDGRPDPSPADEWMHPGSEGLTHTNHLLLNGYVVEAVAAQGAVSEEADERAEYDCRAEIRKEASTPLP